MSGEPVRVVVLGMHRSGTSALAGALAAMGPTPGADASLLAADPGNARGYFERHDVIAANEALLVQALREQLGDELDDDAFEDPVTLDGFAWMLGAFLPAPVETRRSSAVQACLDALREEAGDAPAVLLKDPRLCLTLDHWRAAGGRWLAVLALRHPAPVVHSLARRDRMHAHTARRLWAAYTHGALAHSRGLPRMAVDYDALLDEPERVLAGLGAFLEGNGVRLAADAPARAMSMLDGKLRHSPRSRPDAPADEADRLHDRLRAAAPDVPDTLPAAPQPDAAALQRALRLPLVLRCERQAREIVTLDHSRVQLNRLLVHPVTGPVVRLLRRLKRDPGFGRP